MSKKISDIFNYEINRKNFISVVIILAASGLFLIWFFYGSIHPCGILKGKVKNASGSLESMLIQEAIDQKTPVECSKILVEDIINKSGK